MTYSKSRPKILSSGIMDALSSFAYFVLAILFFIFGAVLLNTDVSGGEDNMSGAIQEIGGAFATGILGVLSIVVGIICLIAMLSPCRDGDYATIRQQRLFGTEKQTEHA